MTMPEEPEEPFTAFLVVRLWWEPGASPELRGRFRVGLNPPDGEVATVAVAGRAGLQAEFDRFVSEFEDRCSGRSRNG